MNEFNKDTFLKMYSHYTHLGKNKSINATKTCSTKIHLQLANSEMFFMMILFLTLVLPCFLQKRNQGQVKHLQYHYFTMTLDMLFFEFELHRFYLMHLILDDEVLQQSKSNMAGLQTQLFLTALHGLDRNTLCCAIFFEKSHYMLFHASCFL